MADKLKYSVDMIRKGFDLDLKAMLGPKESHKKRKKPKIVMVGIQKKIAIGLVMLVGFSINLTVLLIFQSSIKETLNTVIVLHTDATSLVDTYSTFVEETNKIEHYARFDL
jgi:hypothetical protein